MPYEQCLHTDMSKIIIVAVISLLAVNTIKQIKGEYAVALSLAISTVLIAIILPDAKRLYLSINDLMKDLPYTQKLFTDLTKICLIGYGCKFTCNLCDEYGSKSISDKIDLACRIYTCSIAVSWLYKLLVDINKLL